MILSIEELKRWCRRHTKRGQHKYRNEKNRELAVHAFLRSLDWAEMEFYKWLNKGGSMPERVQRTMSKFVADWEAGYLEFTPWHSTTPRRLVRRETPKRRTRLAVQFREGGPVLSFLERPAVEPRMPAFRDLIRPNLTKR